MTKHGNSEGPDRAHSANVPRISGWMCESPERAGFDSADSLFLVVVGGVPERVPDAGAWRLVDPP